VSTETARCPRCSHPSFALHGDIDEQQNVCVQLIECLGRGALLEQGARCGPFGFYETTGQ